ncbi:MAG: AMP-binding protein [Bacteroidia bacterium]|nr:AMP-binding protein [Bacteroidia bacterium]
MEHLFPDFDTLPEIFYHWESTTPNNVFLRQPKGNSWKEITFKLAGDQSRRIVSALKDMGLRQGDHIAISSKNCYHWILADIAIMMGGFVSVPLYPTLTKSQLAEVLVKSDAKAIFIGKMDNFGDRAKGIHNGIRVIKFPHYEGSARITIGKDWDDLLNQYEPIKGNYLPDPDSLWTILFTSGTTGTPKGVMHLHRTPAWIARDEKQSNWLGTFNSKENRYFSYLPLNHVGERIGVELSALTTGGMISFAESLETFAKNLQDTQPTLFFAVPRIWTKFYLGVLAKMPQKKLDRLLKIPIVSSVVKKKLLTALGMWKVKVAATGAAITPAYIKEWYSKLGIHLIEAYGMTEVCGSMTNGPMKDCPADSVGKAIPGGEIRIASDTGEILMKTPYMMTGYYKEPELTNHVLIDGWMHSGDRGALDVQGYLRVIGRVKDAFKTSKGQFITPNPMEEKLGKNEFIEQVCIAGLNVPQPIALINLSEVGQKTPKSKVEKSLEESLQALNKDLAGYQKISTIVVDDSQWDENNEILTPTLKVRRPKIDEIYMETYPAWHAAQKSIVWKDSFPIG